MDRHRYPDDWEEISLRVRKASGWRCQCVGECGQPGHDPCGVAQGTIVQSAKVNPDGSRNEYRVVLTVAHLDHDPETCRDDSRLKAMCQGCHLRYDAPRHRINAARTRREKANEGQMALELGA